MYRCLRAGVVCRSKIANKIYCQQIEDCRDTICSHLFIYSYLYPDRSTASSKQTTNQYHANDNRRATILTHPIHIHCPLIACSLASKSVQISELWPWSLLSLRVIVFDNCPLIITAIIDSLYCHNWKNHSSAYCYNCFTYCSLPQLRH